MKRLCILKATKRILEMQSGGKIDRKDIMEWSLSIKNPEDRTEEKYQEYLAECDALESMRLNTLKQNAINAGYAEADIDVKWVTDAEYLAAKAEDPNEIVAQEAQAAMEAVQAAKAQAIIDNLPARAQMHSAINNIDSFAKLQNYLHKLSDVVYWTAKGKAE